MTTKALFRAEDIEGIQFQTGRKFELIRGELYEATNGYRDAQVVTNIASLLGAWESHAGLGDVLVSAGFTLERNPDTVRGPDVSFVRKGAFRMALPPAATPRSVRTPRSRSVRPTTPGPSWSPRRKSI